MAELVITIGCRTEQGKRSNNEDCFLADVERQVFLVADGMGGQENGEVASNLAVQIIPRAVQNYLAQRENIDQAVRHALDEAHRAIVKAGHAHSPSTEARKMGTTAVLAVQNGSQCYVAGVGDSPAFLVRGDRVEQLTLDHTVADALARSGTITPEQARISPWRNVLYRFLGCAEMTDEAEVRPFTPQPGDRLILASDGLAGHITHDDLREGARRFRDPQMWVNQLVELALARGSRDNVTCIVIAFDDGN